MKTLRLAALLCASLSGLSAQTQTFPVINWTPQPASARFALIQGNDLIYATIYRLDRYTGRIWKRATEKDSPVDWVPVLVSGLPSIASPKTPRFQMAWLAGASGTNTQILLDCETGRTWRMSGRDWKPERDADQKE